MTLMRRLVHRHIGVRAEGMILAAGIWVLIGTGAPTAVVLPFTGIRFRAAGGA